MGEGEGLGLRLKSYNCKVCKYTKLKVALSMSTEITYIAAGSMLSHCDNIRLVVWWEMLVMPECY